METSIILKSRFPRDIINEIKWKGYDINKCKIYYINRGSPGDIDSFWGDKIIEIGAVHLTLMSDPYEKYIPYHRIIKIECEDRTVFIRPGHTTNGHIRLKNMNARDEFKINTLRDLESSECTYDVRCPACKSSNISKE
jgi:uncharacterized protein (UPF0248 family)